jgi:hypothetical protein
MVQKETRPYVYAKVKKDNKEITISTSQKETVAS